MLPPLQPSLHLEISKPASESAVPQFATLYRVLREQVLDPRDASTRVNGHLSDENQVADELRTLCIEDTRLAILIRSLREICLELARDEKQLLSREVKELVIVVATYCAVSVQHSTASRDTTIVDQLMNDEVEQFRAQMSNIGRALGKHIQHLECSTRDMVGLARDDVTASVDQELSNTFRSLAAASQPSPQQQQQQQQQKRNATITKSTSSQLMTQVLDYHTECVVTTLPTSLTKLNNTLYTLLETLQTLLTSHIRSLELFVHSTHARHLTTRATFLATVAEGMSLKAGIASLLHEKEIYAEENLREALDDRYHELASQERQLEEREKRLTGLLAEFENEGGIKIMGQLGEEYQRIEEEIELVKADIEKLGTGDGVRRSARRR